MACPLRPRGKERSTNITKFLEDVKISGYLSTDECRRRLHQSIFKAGQWKPSKRQLHGSIFNLAFSQDGKILLSAGEKHDVLIFDPNLHKKIGEISCAHNDCVNFIRFLDQRMFATCSDDKTIALWDLRKPDAPMNVLKGHKSWVKSIEYDQNTRQLLSSAFDDTVRIWDINSYSSDGKIKGKIALRLLGLVRAKLSPDCSKLFLTTSSGCGISVIHNLDINRITRDYMLQSTTGNNTETNRLEVITNFPAESRPACISSIDVHPYGWCILSRYVDEDGRREWTAVHDVQDPYVGGGNNTCQQPSSTLTHFIEEPNVGRGFIKEICFSADGRLICSPFGNGVRLLAFDKNCSELSMCVPDSPRELCEVKTLIGHKRTVLAAKFSPCLPLLATGGLDGLVSFYLPKL